MSNNEFHDSRLRSLVRQQILGLRSFGATEWEKPNGKYDFELLEAVETVTKQRQDRPPQKASSTAPSGSTQAQDPEPTSVSGHATSGRDLTPKIEGTAKPQISSRPQGQMPSKEVVESYPAKLELAERESRFQVLNSKVVECKLCPQLCEYRTQTVFGVGNLRPRLVFLGEAPGEDEDKQGEPFVGRAGQLLTKIIQAMKLTRDDVYILNTVKCRPPLNRNPSEVETENCWGYLVEQLDVLQPEIICCLGSVAMRRLLNTSQSIGRMRGQFFRYKESKVAVTYHPSYLLRMENQTIRGISPKRMVWDDMKMILAELGLSID